MSVVVDVIPIQLDTKPKEFIDLYTKANPLPNVKPKTPLLCHYYYHKREGENVKDEATETTILCESTVIVDYLVDVFAMSLESTDSMSSSLFVPTNPSDRAIIKLFNHTFVDKAFKASGPSTMVISNPSTTYIIIMEAPYIKPFTQPFRLVSFVKKLTVIGIIGKTQGVNKAANPPRIPAINNHHKPSFSC